jgi:transposase-like protein
MAYKYTPTFLDNAERFIRQGKTLKEVSAAFGCNPSNLSKFLRARGVDVGDERRGRPAYNRINTLPDSEIVSLHVEGRSVLSLAKQFGVDRIVINRILKEANITARSASDAMRIRWANMSPDERLALHLPANIASAGKARTREFLLKRAAAGIRIIGKGEEELASAMENVGYIVHRQKSIEIYNIDFVFGSVAVEVRFGSKGYAPSANTRERFKSIFNAGYTPVIVVFRDDNAIANGIDDVVSKLQFVSRQPPSIGKYWVIWSRLEYETVFHEKTGQLTRIPTSPNPVAAIREIDY